MIYSVFFCFCPELLSTTCVWMHAVYLENTKNKKWLGLFFIFLINVLMSTSVLELEDSEMPDIFKALTGC